MTEKPSTTYNVAPLSMRMSLADKQNINDWAHYLQTKTNRKVSAGKLFRALCDLKDEVDEEELLKRINDMN